MTRRVLPRSQCPTCGNDVADDESYCTECRITCKRCGMSYEPDEVDTETRLCDDCERLEITHARLHEAIRRLEAWATREGTRRHVASALAEESERYLRSSTQRHVVRWLLVWETSGSRKELRKVVEQLEPHWQRAGKKVADPVKASEESRRRLPEWEPR